MGDVRVSEPLMSNEPRPSAKHNAMHGVEIEQISVASPKPKPGTAPKPVPKGNIVVQAPQLYDGPVMIKVLQ